MELEMITKGDVDPESKKAFREVLQDPKLEKLFRELLQDQFYQYLWGMLVAGLYLVVGFGVMISYLAGFLELTMVEILIMILVVCTGVPIFIYIFRLYRKFKNELFEYAVEGFKSQLK